MVNRMYRENHSRLAKIKQHCDPGNLLWLNANMRPVQKKRPLHWDVFLKVLAPRDGLIRQLGSLSLQAHVVTSSSTSPIESNPVVAFGYSSFSVINFARTPFEGPGTIVAEREGFEPSKGY
jgi:hypothetical protein